MAAGQFLSAHSGMDGQPRLTHTGLCPNLGTGVFGVGLITVFMSANTYLVDSYIVHAAPVASMSAWQGKSAHKLTSLQTAASTALRSLVGAVIPLAGLSI